MRRPLAVLVLTAAALLGGLAAPAHAAFEVPGPDCLPVPDGDGHVWYLCHWKP